MKKEEEGRNMLKKRNEEKRHEKNREGITKRIGSNRV